MREVVRDHSKHGLVHRILQTQSCESTAGRLAEPAAALHIHVSFSKHHKDSMATKSASNRYACPFKPPGAPLQAAANAKGYQQTSCCRRSAWQDAAAARRCTPYNSNRRGARPSGRNFEIEVGSWAKLFGPLVAPLKAATMCTPRFFSMAMREIGRFASILKPWGRKGPKIQNSTPRIEKDGGLDPPL